MKKWILFSLISLSIVQLLLYVGMAERYGGAVKLPVMKSEISSTLNSDTVLGKTINYPPQLYYYHKENTKLISYEMSIPSNKLSLIASPTETKILNGNINYFRLYLINDRFRISEFTTFDSYFLIYREVYYKNSWKVIVDKIDCGNGMDKYSLLPLSYCYFYVPFFEGTVKTKQRFKIFLNGDSLVSNEFEDCISKEHFEL